LDNIIVPLLCSNIIIIISLVSKKPKTNNRKEKKKKKDSARANMTTVFCSGQMLIDVGVEYSRALASVNARKTELGHPGNVNIVYIVLLCAAALF
jgi:hypothetical protein